MFIQPGIPSAGGPSSTVLADQGTAGVDPWLFALPTGASTSAKQDTGNTSLSSIDGKVPALEGGRIPVVLPAGGSGLTDAEMRATPVPVSGTITANIGTVGTLATLAKQDTIIGHLDGVEGSLTTLAGAVTGTEMQVDVLTMPTVAVTGTFWQATQPVSGTFWQATQPVSNAGLTALNGAIAGTEVQVDVLTMPTVTVNTHAVTLASTTITGTVAVTQSGTWILGANSGVDIGDVTINNASLAVTGTFWQATQPVSGTFFQATQPVSIAATVAVKEVRSATPAQSSPSVTNASTSILASNANRLGATIYNEGSAICYMKLGATASTTSYTLQIAVGGYYEIPFAYTGAIDGITSSGTAQLRVTEIT